MKKQAKLRNGSLLIETTVALSLLIALGLILLQYVINITQISNWISTQTLTEAALSYEVAYMEKIPLKDALASDSPFPRAPFHARSSTTIGTLRAGVPKQGEIRRMRLPIFAGNSNFQLERWRFFTSLEYEVNGTKYFKTRSVIRVR